MKKNTNALVKRTIARVSFVWIVFLAAQILWSIDVPELKGRVNDYAGVLNSSQKEQLETLLQDVENKTSSQVVLLTINSLEGEALEDFSIRVVENWKIGQKEFSNGVLVLLALAEKKIRIEVGYGLESIITDMKSGYIIREIILPYFKKGDYYNGLNQGLTAVTGLISRDFEITPEQLARYQKEGKRGKGVHIPFTFIIFVIIVILNIMKSGTRGGRFGRGGGVFYGGGFGSGGFGGGGFSGGGGGGGFSGGGGSFGGGGSSGSW
ncbi:MAG: uncharacterized protein QG657_5688 [Acidobacteriota bacterium]|nr:uncharacterized protein [Acidobacteriota bacterium]